VKTRLVLVLAFLALATWACDSSSSTSSAVSTSAPSKDISGTYDVAGTDLEGVTYTGEMTLTRTSGNDYDIEYRFGDSTEKGSGTLDGDTFTGTWSTGDASGKLTFTVLSSGVLTGTWTQDGKSGQGAETLTPQK